MSLFKKKLPKVCPKCGEEKGWSVVHDDPSHSAMDNYRSSSFSAPNPVYGTFGSAMTGRVNKRKNTIRFRCEKCGFEKEY